MSKEEGWLQAIKVAQKVNAWRVKRPHRVPCACAAVQMSFLDGEIQGAECEDGPVGTPPTFVGGSRCSTCMQPADLKSPNRCRPPRPCRFERWIIISRRTCSGFTRRCQAVDCVRHFWTDSSAVSALGPACRSSLVPPAVELLAAGYTLEEQPAQCLATIGWSRSTTSS